MTKVRAVKSKEQVHQIADLLGKHYGEHFSQIWRFAVNVGLRMGDVLSITMKQARDGLEVGYIEIKEQKTLKYNRFSLNAGAREIIMARLKGRSAHKWLFQSESRQVKKLARPLTRQAMYVALKDIGDMVGIKLGTHSARKTRGRLLYESGVPLATVKEVLNHTDIKTTLIYIDVTEDEKQKTYDELVV